MPDPNATHRLTTATVPEWAAEVTVGVAQLQAEIARLREHRDGYMWEAADLKRDLMDVKAECCRLVCRNGDLEKLAGVVRRVISMFCVERGFGPICEIANALDVIDKKEPQ